MEGCFFGFLPSSANPKTRYVVQQAKKGLSSLLERLSLVSLYIALHCAVLFDALGAVEDCPEQTNQL